MKKPRCSSTTLQSEHISRPLSSLAYSPLPRHLIYFEDLPLLAAFSLISHDRLNDSFDLIADSEEESP